LKWKEGKKNSSNFLQIFLGVDNQLQFNAPHKHKLGWLSDKTVINGKEQQNMID
jgi:hypothetical protein